MREGANAEADDANGILDLSILSVRVAGMKSDALRKTVLDTWLAATGTGVTTSTITLDDR